MCVFGEELDLLKQAQPTGCFRKISTQLLKLSEDFVQTVKRLH